MYLRLQTPWRSTAHDATSTTKPCSRRQCLRGEPGMLHHVRWAVLRQRVVPAIHCLRGRSTTTPPPARERLRPSLRLCASKSRGPRLASRFPTPSLLGTKMTCSALLAVVMEAAGRLRTSDGRNSRGAPHPSAPASSSQSCLLNPRLGALHGWCFRVYLGALVFGCLRPNARLRP